MAPIYFFGEDFDRLLQEDGSFFIFEEDAPGNEWTGSGEILSASRVAAIGRLIKTSNTHVLLATAVGMNGGKIQRGTGELNSKQFFNAIGQVDREGRLDSQFHSAAIPVGERNQQGRIELLGRSQHAAEGFANLAGQTSFTQKSEATASGEITHIFHANIPLYIAGYDAAYNNIDFSTGGHDNLNSEVNLSSYGHETKSREIDMTAHGRDLTSDSLDFITAGSYPAGSGLTLVTYGANIINDYIPLHSKGIVPIVGSTVMRLFAGGKTNALPASGTLRLYARATTNKGVFKTIPLSVPNASVPNSFLNLYTQGYSSGFSGVLNLATLGYTPSIQGSLSLYANNDGVFNSIPLFTEGLRITIGDTFEDSDGWIPLAGEMNLYVKRPLSNVLTLACFSNFESGVIPLVTVGGIISSEELNLSVPETHAILNKLLHLFTHGY